MRTIDRRISRWQGAGAVVIAAAGASLLGAPGCHIVLGLDKATISEGGGGAGGDGGAGGTGGTTTSDPTCVPANIGAPVSGDCGVFVSSSLGSDDTSDPARGRPDKPYATIGKALAESGGKPLYLCAESFSEAIALSEDATLYGALDCTNGANGWAYVGATTKTTWTASASATPLHLVTGARATLEDVTLEAADASTAGSSSIAVIAEAGTQLDLLRCDVRAGQGANGADGDAAVGTGTAGVNGDGGTDGCTSDAAQVGGSGGQLTCEGATPTNVAGGDGGNGTKNMTGGAGSPGIPLGSMGIAGFGQGVNVDCATDGNGGEGAAGMSGERGAGAPMALGTLSPAGYVGAPGGDGLPGKPGQGGGGGGGGKVCTNGKAGPSGGGGGSGGCGGAGGKGGQAGGASIGIVSLGAKLTLDAVTITTKAGGKGGSGAAGQPGGTGGAGGTPGTAEAGGNPATACVGGTGGSGGQGGKGGGGKGGPSIGVAHTGDAPSTTAATITTGAPGAGGDGEGESGKGATGATGKVVSFD